MSKSPWGFQVERIAPSLLTRANSGADHRIIENDHRLRSCKVCNRDRREKQRPNDDESRGPKLQHHHPTEHQAAFFGFLLEEEKFASCQAVAVTEGTLMLVTPFGIVMSISLTQLWKA
jgi:hypothetical protein